MFSFIIWLASYKRSPFHSKKEYSSKVVEYSEIESTCILTVVEYSEKESTTILKVLEESKKDYSRTF